MALQSMLVEATSARRSISAREAFTLKLQLCRSLDLISKCPSLPIIRTLCFIHFLHIEYLSNWVFTYLCWTEVTVKVIHSKGFHKFSPVPRIASLPSLGPDWFLSSQSPHSEWATSLRWTISRPSQLSQLSLSSPLHVPISYSNRCKSLCCILGKGRLLLSSEPRDIEDKSVRIPLFGFQHHLDIFAQPLPLRHPIRACGSLYLFGILPTETQDSYASHHKQCSQI